MKKSEIEDGINVLIKSKQKLATVKLAYDILREAQSKIKPDVYSASIGLKLAKDSVDSIERDENPGKSWLKLIKETYPIHYKNLRYVKND